MDITTDLTLSYAPRLDALFIVAEDAQLPVDVELLQRHLALLSPDKLFIAGLDTGSYWMARAGLLSGYRATLHWQEINRFTEEFPDVIVSSNLYEIDRNRGSCAGRAAAGFHAGADWPAHGADFAAQLSEVFSIERIRPATSASAFRCKPASAAASPN